MAFNGGDVVQLTCDHPVLGTVVLAAKAAEDNSIDLGGVRGVDDKSMISGSGETVRSLNMNRWETKITVLWDMSLRLEKEKLIALAGHPQEGVWTIVHVNGSIYKGTGSPVGEISANMNQVTLPLTLQGGGKLEKVA